MKFFHLADLHLGRKLLGESLIRTALYIRRNYEKCPCGKARRNLYLWGSL